MQRIFLIFLHEIQAKSKLNAHKTEILFRYYMWKLFILFEFIWFFIGNLKIKNLCWNNWIFSFEMKNRTNSNIFFWNDFTDTGNIAFFATFCQNYIFFNDFRLLQMPMKSFPIIFSDKKNLSGQFFFSCTIKSSN